MSKTNQEIPNWKFRTHTCSDQPYYCNFNHQGLSTHRHADFYEFSIIISGIYTNVYHAKNSDLSTGSLLFFAPGQVHSLTEQDPNSQHYSFIVQQDYFEKFVKEHFDNADLILLTPYLAITKLENPVFLYLAHMASICARCIAVEQRIIVEQFLYTLIFHSLANLPELAENTTSFYAIDLLRRLNRYDLHDARLGELYREYPISSRKLIEEFTQLTGETIVQYKTKKKMEYASFLLSEENYSISTIADMLHISSLSYFSKQFKNQYGVTPKQWKIAHRKKEFKKNESRTLESHSQSTTLITKAPTRFELVIEVLQTFALPLGYGAI